MSEGVDELKRFLSEQAKDGELSDVGSFTLELRSALEKLSAFQLPFDGCWALKLIQAAVSSGCATTIRVKSTTRSITFDFEGSYDWSGLAIQGAILNPGQKVCNSLGHLSVGLRVLSFHLQQSWTLALGESGDLLAWDGEKFCLSQCQPTEGVKFSLTRTLASNLQEEMEAALLERAHTCPVPLFLEGYRIDSLELNPDHGYGVRSQPLAIGFPKGELPSFPVPKATGSTDIKLKYSVQESLKAATKLARQAHLPKDGRCHMAFLLAAHLEKEPELVIFNTWNYKENKSQRYWIYDGVIVEREPINNLSLPCSIGCFLSAQDLTLDAGGFGVKDDAEKRRRIFQARQLLRNGLAELFPFDYETLIAHDKNRVQMKSSLFLLGGLLSLPASTAVAGFLVVIGATGLATGETKLVKEWVKVINKALRDLKRGL